MKPTVQRIACALIACLVTAGPARAAQETYTLDKPHTQIMFSVDHMGFSHSQGKFLDYTGNFTLDRADPAHSTIDVTIPTASLDMGDAAWNKAVMAEGYLDTAHYPSMHFRSLSVQPTDSHHAKVAGELTLLGVTKPVILDVTFNKAGQHPFENTYIVGFSASTTIDRSAFGMKGGWPLVGNKVDITIEVEGDRKKIPGQELYNQ